MDEHYGYPHSLHCVPESTRLSTTHFRAVKNYSYRLMHFSRQTNSNNWQWCLSSASCTRLRKPFQSMPSAPVKPCKHPGCPNLGCKEHTSSVSRRAYDKERGSAHSRGYDSEWNRVRKQALQRDRFLCLHCLAANRVILAIDVDHIVPVTVRPDLRLDLTNLQSLCRSCHVRKTKAEPSSA